MNTIKKVRFTRGKREGQVWQLASEWKQYGDVILSPLEDSPLRIEMWADVSLLEIIEEN